MNELDYQRLVIGYHGCDAQTVNDVLLNDQPLKLSENEYDWLGKGIYFWEYGPQRAEHWACEEAKRSGKIKTPAVLGAYIHLGNCFDLLDVRNTELLKSLYPEFVRICAEKKIPLPQNKSPGGSGEDLVLRFRDCAVVNWCLDQLKDTTDYQTVRCVFSEGSAAFDGSKILLKSHIQIAVRDPDCIVGFFKPKP